MNKSELVTALAAKTESKKVEAEKFLKAFEEVITETLTKGEKVSIVGFGTFDILERAAHEGTLPGNKDKKIMIPASKSPRFKAGKSLKDTVNGRA